MKRCPKCRAEFDDSAVFCDQCGTKLVTANVCPHCGAVTHDDSAYCPSCGRPLVPEEEKKVAEVYTEAAKKDYELTKLQRELTSYRSRKTGMAIAGSILLGLGATLFTVCMILLINLDYDSYSFVSLYLLLIFGLVITELMIDAGIVLLIVQSAVFNKKISNRQRAIEEFNFRQ